LKRSALLSKSADNLLCGNKGVQYVSSGPKATEELTFCGPRKGRERIFLPAELDTSSCNP